MGKNRVQDDEIRKRESEKPERKGRRGKRDSLRKREGKFFFMIIGGRSGGLKQRTWAARARERESLIRLIRTFTTVTLAYSQTSNQST